MKIKNVYKFFDYFGLPVFSFLIFDSIFYIITGNYDWRVMARLLIGIGGVIVDGFLVLVYKEKTS